MHLVVATSLRRRRLLSVPLIGLPALPHLEHNTTGTVLGPLAQCMRDTKCRPQIRDKFSRVQSSGGLFWIFFFFLNFFEPTHQGIEIWCVAACEHSVLVEFLYPGYGIPGIASLAVV